MTNTDKILYTVIEIDTTCNLWNAPQIKELHTLYGFRRDTHYFYCSPQKLYEMMCLSNVPTFQDDVDESERDRIECELQEDGTIGEYDYFDANRIERMIKNGQASIIGTVEFDHDTTPEEIFEYLRCNF